MKIAAPIARQTCPICICFPRRYVCLLARSVAIGRGERQLAESLSRHGGGGRKRLSSPPASGHPAAQTGDGMDPKKIWEHFVQIISNHYFDMNGRMSRPDFWYFVLVCVCVEI